MTQTKNIQNKRNPTTKQLKAVEKWVENGGNMSKALLSAGYSEASAKNPQKVFGSPILAPFLHEREINPSSMAQRIADKLVQLMDTKKSTTMDFRFGTLIDGTAFGEEHIREFLEEGENIVLSVVKLKKCYRAYYLKPNNSIQLRAIDMIIRLFGWYAPKQVAQKTKQNHPTSLSRLRSELREKRRNITDPRIQNPGIEKTPNR